MTLAPADGGGLSGCPRKRATEEDGNNHHVGGGERETQTFKGNSVFSHGVRASVSSVYTSASAGPSIILKPMSSVLADVPREEQQYTIGVEVDNFEVPLSIRLLFPIAFRPEQI